MKKCPNQSKSPCSVQTQEIRTRNNYVFGHFSCSVKKIKPNEHPNGCYQKKLYQNTWPQKQKRCFLITSLFINYNLFK